MTEKSGYCSHAYDVMHHIHRSVYTFIRLASPSQRPHRFSFLFPRFLSSRPSAHSSTTNMAESTTVNKTEEEWQAILSPEQFRILRQKGTERAGTGIYDKHKEDGTYCCAACNAPLYTSGTKFNSGCGWPAFFTAIPGAVSRHEDRSFGVTRTEITCTACGGHLGHVFKGEGFPTPTDERHCVNSVSLKFNKE